MSKKPEGGKLSEILKSGRSPGFTVAGGTQRGGPTVLKAGPVAYDGSLITPKQREREDIANLRGIHDQMREEKLHGRGASVRLAGGCPVSVWSHKMQQTGGDVAEVKRQLAREGFIDETV